MRWLLFLSRLAFICNVLFLIAFFVPFGKLGTMARPDFNCHNYRMGAGILVNRW